MARVINNTSFETDFLIKEQRHLITALVDSQKIESIVFDDERTLIFGEDVLLAEFNPMKDLTLFASLRWYDATSGDAMVRLESGASRFIYLGRDYKGPNCFYVLIHADAFVGCSLAA
jgi:hypothetical protein